MSDKAKHIISRAFLLLLVLLPNIYALFAASDLHSPLKAIAYMAVVGVGLAIPMLFLRARTYFIVIGCVCLPLAPVEIASLYLNHSPATATFLGFVYHTNWREVIGILGSSWPVLLGLIALWTAYFIVAARQPREWLIPRRIGLWAIGIAIPLLLIGAIGFFGYYARRIYNMQQPGEVIGLARELTVLKFYKIYPYNLYLNTGHLMVEHRRICRQQAELASFRFGVERASDEGLYVLVIGEAARSENFALNGYGRMTTPLLGARRNLVSYPHMYSQSGTTETAVPHMISRVTVSDHGRVYSEKTLPEAFQEAGYEAVWLTNKSRAFYMERILGAMDLTRETGKDMSAVNNYDGYLLEPLREALADSAHQRFVVVHTMGSHWRYDTRYTPEFERFTPAIGEDFQLTMIAPANRQMLLNAYDNTIVYTDYFLDSLLSLVEAAHTPAVVLYMSDHGENLYDDERQLVLHGNYSASRWLFHVPMIVWYSDEYAALYPDKVAQLHAHAASRDNSSVVFHSLMDAAGLAYTNDTASSAQMRTRSIFSPGYTAPDTLWVLTTEDECIVLDE